MAKLEVGMFTVEIKQLVEQFEDYNGYYNVEEFFLAYQLKIFIGSQPLFNPVIWDHYTNTGALLWHTIDPFCEVTRWLTRFLNEEEHSKSYSNYCSSMEMELLKKQREYTAYDYHTFVALETFSDCEYFLGIRIPAHQLYLDGMEYSKKGDKSGFSIYLPVNLGLIEKFRDDLEREFKELDKWMDKTEADFQLRKGEEENY